MSNHPEFDHYDAVIIGAGLSGLAAGIRLSYYEKKVLILERHTIPGGLNSYFSRKGRIFSAGLHAFTNYVPKATRGAALTKLLRQLRIPHDELELGEQAYSLIDFPSCKMKFTNDPEIFRQEVAENFPAEIDNFDQFCRDLAAFDETSYDAPAGLSARTELEKYFSDKLLREMLLCPVMFYGNPQADDMDFTLFVVVWKCLFSTGLARPRRGMKPVIDRLVESYTENGGELAFRCGAKSINVGGDKVVSITLDDGSEITAGQVYSSAGWVETMRLCSGSSDGVLSQDIGGTSLVEIMACLDCEPKSLGIEPTVVFYNNNDEFRFRRPDGFVDMDSGVIAVPDNYIYDEPLGENMVRMSVLANFDRWYDLLGHFDSTKADLIKRDSYNEMKSRIGSEVMAEGERHIANFASRATFVDIFTPLTLKRYTGHCEGALYGSPVKHRDGRTDYENLYLIGADQGFHGIVGALLSGISMANLHGLV